jgi:hypothetical protein
MNTLNSLSKQSGAKQGLFLWTAPPLAAKPPAGSPVAARAAATPKKPKKPRKSRHVGRKGKHK